MKKISVLILVAVLALVAGASYHPSSGSTVPSGAVVMIVAGNCSSTLGSGWTEEATLNDKFPRGTVAASSDIGGTGGTDTITGSTGTPVGTVDVQTGVGTTVANSTHTHDLGSGDNKPAFVNVIFCKRD